MAGFTNYLEDKIINHLFGDATGVGQADNYVAPTTWYVGLQTASPSDSAGGTEVSGGGYARQSVAWSLQTGGVAQASNTSALTWDAATTDWGQVTHAGVYDAATSGNLIAYETLTKADFSTANPKTVNTGDIFKIDSANLKIQLD
jgi:hypothetical protein|tara:strand:- start:141 stop:575 length:435 start_codon:yes stop_codon:yes gene_type:complete